METKPLVHIVEDDEAMSQALGSLVEVLGFQTRSYRTAHEFLAAYRPGGAACLIIDVGLPGMSGLDLQKKLVEMEIAPPVIFITGHGDEQAAEQALAAGALEFLEKPFPSERLAAAIRRAMWPDGKK